MHLILLAAAALSLRLTLPRFEADSLQGCEPGSRLCQDLDSLFADGQPVNPAAPVRRLAALSVRGREGEALRLDLPLSPDSAYAVSITTRNLRGQASCPARIALGPWPLAVVPQPVLKLEWFDIAGRRVAYPTVSGVYLWRRGRARGRMALIR